jgi:hypothetical protein
MWKIVMCPTFYYITVPYLTGVLFNFLHVTISKLCFTHITHMFCILLRVTDEY